MELLVATVVAVIFWLGFFWLGFRLGWRAYRSRRGSQ